jgi:predicted AlkP superfamily pyrophosphatase or phosphodiesterase
MGHELIAEPNATASATTVATPKTPSRLHIFILIDALGWKLIESQDFLNDLLAHRQPLQTVLGFSSGAIPTILTGLLPSQTGHWNLYYYDPKGSPFSWMKHFGWVPDVLLDNRLGHKVFKELGRRFLGLGPVFECLVNPKLLQYFNWIEKRNLYGENGIPGSSSIFDQLAEQRIPYRVYSYHHQNDGEILESAKRDLAAANAKFFFIYLSEVDHFLHQHCHEPEQIAGKLQEYAAGLRQIYALAERQDPRMTFTVISDHGMTPVENHYDIIRDVDALALKTPMDYLAVYDSTMARFWFFNERARSKVRACLEKIPCGRILTKDELQKLGIYFADGRYGEFVFLLDPRWMFARSDFHGQWMPRGMHGYHPDDPWSDAIFLSNHEPPSTLASIRDLYQCLRQGLRREASDK